MKHYVITEKVTLQAGEKEFHKDQTITADDVGQANLDRYLKKGYIRLLGDDLTKPAGTGGGNLPFYLTAEDFLTPEQVDKLTKPQLIKYAGHIGYTGFKANTTAADLKKTINQFIEEAMDDEDDDDPDDDSEGNKESGAED